MLVTAPIDPIDCPNPITGLPGVSTGDLTLNMRVDQSIGSDRLQSLIANAYDEVNAELVDFINSTVMATTPIALNDLQKRLYIRAVLHEASAMFSEQYVDYDTASNGRTRDEKQVSIVDKPQRMRRVVNHCIAALRNIPRNRVRLI